MSHENVVYIRSMVKAVPAEMRDGYKRALEDIVRVTGEVPYMGSFIDSETRELVRDMAKAVGVPISTSVHA